MIHLNDAPILLDFLSKKIKDTTIQSLVENFYISGKCNCNQSDCATVVLKKRRSINIDRFEFDIQSSEGFVDFHWIDDEYLEIECLCHTFPHKFEINRLFPKN